MLEHAAARNYERIARRISRVVTLVAAPLAVLAILDELGLIGDLLQREPFYTIVVTAEFAIALVGLPLLAVLAAIGSFRLARNWRYALPAWLYALAALLVAADLFVFDGEADMWAPAGALMGASLLAAAWAGWILKPGPGGQ